MTVSEPATTNLSSGLWQLLWDVVPTGLLVVDAELYIKQVNPAFCQLFCVTPDAAIGQPAETLLDDVRDFKRVWETGVAQHNQLREYNHPPLLVNQAIVPIEAEGLLVCVMTDFSDQLAHKREQMRLKQETIKQVNEVVDHQMKVVQEIAGLLGETTAETKISLLKVIQILQHESADAFSVLAPEGEV